MGNLENSDKKVEKQVRMTVLILDNQTSAEKFALEQLTRNQIVFSFG
jgi:hypothetical protein